MKFKDAKKRVAELSALEFRTEEEVLEILVFDRHCVDKFDSLLDAMEHVQKALAAFRDGETTYKHPEHGSLLLEEVKYCVVDPVLEAAREVEGI